MGRWVECFRLAKMTREERGVLSSTVPDRVRDDVGTRSFGQSIRPPQVVANPRRAALCGFERNLIGESGNRFPARMR